MAAESTLTSRPSWYARVALRNDAPCFAKDDQSSTAYGPLTLWHNAGDCQVARFGPAGASIALFEGYLLDRPQLAASLHLPREVAAVAIAAQAYEKWQSALFEHLDGAYFLAIWDAQKRSLLLGHDSLGEHPIYFARAGSAIFFASNILALAGCDAVATEPNRLTLALSLLDHHYWPPAGQTFFAQIARLQPGHMIVANDANGLQIRRYWNPWPADIDGCLPEQQAYREFEERLTHAVAQRVELGADGVLLSGGIDSVAIATLATRTGSDRRGPAMLAYSARSGDGGSPGNDEILQDRVARRLGLPHVAFRQTDEAPAQTLLHRAIALTPLLPAPTNVWWLAAYVNFYRHVAAQGADSVLTGSGGDEWLGVHPSYCADLLRRGRLPDLIHFSISAWRTGGYSLRQIFNMFLWRNGLRLPVCSQWQRLSPQQKARYHRQRIAATLPPWLCPDDTLKQTLQDYLFAARVPDLNSSGQTPASYYNHTLSHLWRNALMTHELEYSHHIQDQVGLRLLNPFHDRRLIEFLSRVPPHILQCGNRYKGLLRPLVARHLPGLDLENQRKISDVSVKSYIGRGLAHGLEDLIGQKHLSDRLLELGIVHSDKFATMCQRNATLSVPQRASVFAVYMTDAWVSCHMRSTTTPLPWATQESPIPTGVQLIRG